ncbi:MAG: hypothetical protein ACYTGN_04885 [Planctomycetota bacterium]
MAPIEWDAAQQCCNFVLFRPERLPEGAVVLGESLRREAEPGRTGNEVGRSPWTETNRAAHRCMVVLPSGRVRVKQFLYDWAPPAFDHPALWKTEVQPFVAGRRIGWLGTDYRGRAGASLHARRTMVELSVESGDVADADLAAILRGLRAVSEDAGVRIDATPLALLSYAHRHPDPVVTVPVGYFRHHRSGAGLRLHASAGKAAPPGLRGAEVARRLAEHCAVDSVFLVGPPEAPVEVDWVLRDPTQADTSMRVLATARDGPHAIASPPDREPQPCRTSVREVGSTLVHCAWADDRYGPHEAVWTRRETTFMLLARPRPDRTTAWFAALLDNLPA